MIEIELVAYLLADAGLSLLIGNRLYDDILPQSPTLPAVVWQRIDTTRFHSQSGPSKLAKPRFQFSCWAITRLESIQVSAALRDALDGFRGLMNTQEVPAVFNEEERDDIDPETGLRRVMLDFFIWHKE
jgi:hypothetical protein